MPTGTREGPKTTYSCVGCKYHDKDYDGCGDFFHWCEHPDVTYGADNDLHANFFTTNNGETPEWCPYMIQIGGK